MRHEFGKDFLKSSKYEGLFSFDKKSGNWIIKLNTGDMYEGEFKNNKINGYGYYVWKNNNHENIVNFVNRRFHGKDIINGERLNI